ncbi:hypothetical protein KSP35_21115 [Aquihabitans sp. G128]|uniref:DUF6508 domain-containing protein n=1 Tax=Aquihabitans sp. G128 TaxID=2849779 RepID=UPI001C24F86C|nr:DUF6508 domain-containing protein [Aquihabitans sp. G128]QXC60793.1 hypothetical protein KSP35_21115 [Aquihabitans sp. G128]
MSETEREGEDALIVEGLLAADEARWARLWTAVDAVLGEPSDQWVTWRGGQRLADGSVQAAWADYSPNVLATLTALASVDAITPFDWMAWMDGWDGIEHLRTGPVTDAVRYLTAVVRNDRMVEGSINQALHEGTFQAALARLRTWYDTER